MLKICSAYETRYTTYYSSARQNNFCWPAFSSVSRDEIEVDPTFDVTFRILYLTSVSRGNSSRSSTRYPLFSTFHLLFPTPLIFPYCLRKHIFLVFEKRKYRGEIKKRSLSCKSLDTPSWKNLWKYLSTSLNRQFCSYLAIYVLYF